MSAQTIQTKAASILNNWGVLRGRRVSHFVTEILSTGGIRTACGMSRSRKVNEVELCEEGPRCEQCQIALVTGQKATKLKGSKKNQEIWRAWRAENT